MVEKEKVFFIKDCALAAIATGAKAQMLNEFRDKLAEVDVGSIYFHFWGGRLRTEFEFQEYHNDFSFWAHHKLHDNCLGERLELINPSDYKDLEILRNDLIDIIDERLDELEYVPGTSYENQFHFIRSKIVVYNTTHQFTNPSSLVELLPTLSRSTFFYHFIDARRRTQDSQDDFSNWLNGFGKEYEKLVIQIREIDPYLISLADLQKHLFLIINDFFMKESS